MTGKNFARAKILNSQHYYSNNLKNKYIVKSFYLLFSSISLIQFYINRNLDRSNHFIFTESKIITDNLNLPNGKILKFNSKNLKFSINNFQNDNKYKYDNYCQNYNDLSQSKSLPSLAYINKNKHNTNLSSRITNLIGCRGDDISVFSLLPLGLLFKTIGCANNIISSFHHHFLLADTKINHTINVFKNYILPRFQENEFHLRKLANEVYSSITYILRNIFGMYIFFFSLILPYYIEHIEFFNKVPLNDPYLLESYQLPVNASPHSFGMDYIDVEIESSDPGILLRGWYIPARKNRNSRKAIVCVHGCFGNKQSTLTFIEILNKLGFLDDYHVLTVDMRNSGESTSARTDLGLNGSVDIYDSVAYLNEKIGLNELIIYSQSSGCMSSMLFLNKYMDKLKELNVKVCKLILDSPICNVEKLIKTYPMIMILDSLFYWASQLLLFTLNLRWDRQMYNMKARYLINENLSPDDILILHSKSDKITPVKTVADEILSIDEKIRPSKIFIFNKGAHANLYRYNKDDYEAIIRWFLARNSVFRRLFSRLNLSKSTSALK